MKKLIVCIFIIALKSWAFAYDFKVTNSDGEYIYYIYNADSTSVAVTYDIDHAPVWGESDSTYLCFGKDTLIIPDTIIHDNQKYAVTRISENTFTYSNENITTIFLPKTIDSICVIGKRRTILMPSLGAFYWSSFKSIVIDAENPNYCSSKGIVYSKNKQTLYVYPALNTRDSVFLNEGITEIGPAAFSNARNIKFLELPLSLRRIGIDAFSGVDTLHHLIVKDNVDTIQTGAFDCYGLSHLTLGSGVKVVEGDFFTSDSLIHLYCRATIPPEILNMREGKISTRLKAGSILYVPSKSISTYRNTEGWNQFGTILPIEPPIVAGTDNATVSWVQNFSATGYVWHLYSDEEHTQLVMSLTFDERGYLTELTLGDGMPATTAEHNRAGAPMRGSESDDESDGSERRFAEYYSFTIRSLSPNRQYYYVRQALAGEEVIDEEQGSFETLTDTETGLDNGNTTTDLTPTTATKRLQDGQLLIVSPEGKTYTPDGKGLF